MTLNYQRGDLLLVRVCKALKLDPQQRPVQRIVIDIPVDSVARIYIQEVLAEHESQETLPDILADLAEPQIVPVKQIEIDEFGRVKTEQ